ncbi:MAG: DUF1614 domain-containing protein [Candidatus Syntrophonatronum acetioxidans]|uniref:DUF1614 domain-containing protein n=1 Tax=Candidatus Syntrophonatronum acetioxidans TaxID=1795816 RepID=A0A424Y9W5_9FIRM|nr:MAG: DUF1614 domain-containing protein [Candidatus Syntrophonatronum acetioxidans]
MPVGMILLIGVGILVYLGFAQRALDRMRLTDKQALLFIGALLIGGFIPDIQLTENVSINIGGGILPIFLVGYLLYRADTVKEKKRAVAALLIAAVLVYGATKIVPVEPTYSVFIDPMYLFALLAGIIGYLAGRSRRSAFIAGAGSMVLTDIISRVEVALTGGRGTLVIGGAGAFDAIVVAGIIAVFLAEVVGETREKIQGGTSRVPRGHRKGEENQGEDNPHNQEGE